MQWSLYQGLLSSEPFRYVDKTVMTPQGLRRVRVNAEQEPGGQTRPIGEGVRSCLLCDDVLVDQRDAGVVVWDVDGTLIPADLRWLRRSIAQTYGIGEPSVVFPKAKVHGYTDESIVVDTAVASGIAPADAEAGVPRFSTVLAAVMQAGRDELARVQPACPGVVESIAELHRRGFVQTVLTGNLRAAAEIKVASLNVRDGLDLQIGAYGSDHRDRLQLAGVVARRYREKFGVELAPERTVVVGDAPNDIACARYAGFRVVVVAHRESREELASHGPDAVLDRLDPELVVATITSLVQQP
ncbi:HAD family hydrolase [Actinoplanes solisilvae]|uniref:HAD family hydrolase n=1 Tax=Actinoplanes solisilvae TaxID=2486853 RepID=UPI001F0BD25F|nr:haloacid dehalogenase-like hydrolase [Actinoplanes solisilvae]